MEIAVGDAPVAEIAESPVTTTAESSEVTPVTSSQLPPLQSNAILPQVVAGIESPAVAETDASTTETTQPQSPEGAEIDAGKGERWGNANDELKEMVVSDATSNIQSPLTATYSCLRALADDPAMATLNVTDLHKRAREHTAKGIE